MFLARAAISVIETCDMPLVGSQRAATRDSPGTISLKISSRFTLSSGESIVNPVVLPPGRDKLETIRSKDVVGECKDGNGAGRFLSDFGRVIAASLDDLHVEAYKLGGKLREILGAAARVAQFEGEF